MLQGEEAAQVLDLLREDAERCWRDYAWMLNEEIDGAEPVDPNRQGLARELARMNLTLNTYTQWYWKTDLHNLMHFLRLRADAHAQYEIRAYADAMLDAMERWVPLTTRRSATTGWARPRSRRPASPCCAGCWRARRWPSRTAASARANGAS